MAINYRDIFNVICLCLLKPIGHPQWLSSKQSAGNAGDTGSIPGSRRSPTGGNGNPLQFSCPENPMDRGVWGCKRVRHNLAVNQQHNIEIYTQL